MFIPLNKRKPIIPKLGDLSFPEGMFVLHDNNLDHHDSCRGLIMFLGEIKQGPPDPYGKDGGTYFHVLTPSGPGWIYWYAFHKGVGRA